MIRIEILIQNDDTKSEFNLGFYKSATVTPDEKEMADAIMGFFKEVLIEAGAEDGKMRVRFWEKDI